MIDRDSIDSILDQYRKHGWKLRRVLLSAGLREKDPQIDQLFEGTEIHEAQIDAAWFSRSSTPGLTAWEIRHLSITPFALLETFRDGTSADEIDTVLSSTEARLAEAVSRRRSN